MRRRQFIGLLGGAAAWPLAARAQQPKMPVVGFLHTQSPDLYAHSLAGFQQGLRETGYVQGQNVEVEYRWANNRDDQLQKLVTDLIRRQVDVIVTGGGVSPALAAKAATSTIPIVFTIGGDPVKNGLVPSLNRPGGNITGVSRIINDLVSKRLEVLHQLVPQANVVGYLADRRTAPANDVTNELRSAARALGQEIVFQPVSSITEFEPAFEALRQRQAGALLVASGPLFASNADKIVALAARYGLPANYPIRDFVVAGGLMSYGADLAETWRLGGRYAGRILKGTKPADLPVQLPTKFELVLNLKTAKALGLDIPAKVLALADDVIE
jgi:putative ABC transport system substrate-binding protein